MYKNFILSLLLNFIFNISYAQHCPYRIGAYVLNSTRYSDIMEKCSACDATIKYQKAFSDVQVNWRDFDDPAAGNAGIYQIMPDATNMECSYNHSYSSFNRAVKVLFIPNYNTNGVAVKNLVLKFYNDTLYYMEANASNYYRNELYERNKPGIVLKDSVVKATCSSYARDKKFEGRFLALYFNDPNDDSRAAMLTLDVAVTDYCAFANKTRIQIFNPAFTKRVYEEAADETKQIKYIADSKK